MNLPKDTEWRHVRGFENKYLVSSDGRVFSLLTGKMRKLKTCRKGYKRVAFSLPGNKLYILKILLV